MAWTLVLFDFQGQIPDKSWLDDAGFLPPSMGSGSDVQKRLAGLWPEVEWGSPTHSVQRPDIVARLGFSLEGSHVPCVFLYPGSTAAPDPSEAIIRLCEAYGWSVYDAVLGEFWSLPAPDRSRIELARRRAHRLG